MVRERAALVRVHVQNASCYYPYGIDDRDEPPLPRRSQPPDADGIWAPTCRQVVEIGGTISFIALGEFADGDVQDLTGEVAWSVVPAELGEVTNGVFTGRNAGSGQLGASLDGVQSEPTEVSVVTEPTLVSIAIYAEDGGVGLPVAGEDLDRQAPRGTPLCPARAAAASR